LTGLDSAYAFETPSGVDFVKLPAVKKVGAEAYRSRHLRISFNRVRKLRETLIKAVAKSYDPHMLIVDNVPRGVDGELVPTLEFLRAFRPHTKIVLTLRDILDAPAQIVPVWRDSGVYEALARLYDQIWVVGWKPLFDPTTEYEFPPPVSRKTKFCGYVVRHGSAETSEAVQRELGPDPAPLVVVSAGGGGDGYPLLRLYADALRDAAADGYRSAVFLGPDMPPSERNDLKQRLLPLGRRVLVYDFRPDLVDFLSLASVTVSMAGYNTIAELVAQRRRALVVPRVHPRREQWLRARALERLGVLASLDLEGLTSAGLLAAIRSALDRPPPPKVAMDFGGLRRITQRTSHLLGLSNGPGTGSE